MHSKSVYKAGKLIKISLDYEGGEIRKIRIEGDFFIYPEEGREKLELALVGSRLDKAELAEKIDNAIREQKIEAYGFNGEQLSEAIMQAVK